MDKKEKAWLASIAIFVPMGTVIVGSYLLGRKVNEKLKKVRERNSQNQAQTKTESSDTAFQGEVSSSSESERNFGSGREALDRASQEHRVEKQEIQSHQEEGEGVPDESYLSGIKVITVGSTQVQQECLERARRDPKSRLKYNRAILGLLAKEIEANPEVRFSQILRNLLIVKETRPIEAERGVEHGINWDNEFYLESEALLIRILRSKN